MFDLQKLVTDCIDESFVESLSMLTTLQPDFIKVELTEDKFAQLAEASERDELTIELDEPIKIEDQEFSRVMIQKQVVDSVQYVAYKSNDLANTKKSLLENNIEFLEDEEDTIFLNTKHTRIAISSQQEQLDDDQSQLELALASEKQSRLNLLADFQNYKRRIEKERYENTQLANKHLLGKVLEVIDDCRRALNLDEEIKQNPKGMDMLLEKLESIVTEQGLEAIAINPGDKFDPERMEAIATIPKSDQQSENSVVHVEQQGYVFNSNGNIYRVAKVIIAK